MGAIWDENYWGYHGYPLKVLTIVSEVRSAGLNAVQYFQLQHAAGAQFPLTPVLKAEPIEDHLAPGDLDNPLSTRYSTLLCTDIARMEKKL